jgi:hypothetical protein
MEAGPMSKADLELESELRRWREKKSQQSHGRISTDDRRTVRVNGQEVVVITKPKRAAA